MFCYRSFCYRCNGEGFIITCMDDLCAGEDRCIHGDGEQMCSACGGTGGWDEEQPDMDELDAEGNMERCYG